MWLNLCTFVMKDEKTVTFFLWTFCDDNKDVIFMMKIAMFSDKNKCNENDPQGKPSEDILPHQQWCQRCTGCLRHPPCGTGHITRQCVGIKPRTRKSGTDQHHIPIKYQFNKNIWKFIKYTGNSGKFENKIAWSIFGPNFLFPFSLKNSRIFPVYSAAQLLGAWPSV